MNAWLFPAILAGVVLGLLVGSIALLLSPLRAAWGIAALPSALLLLILSVAAGAGLGAFASWIASLDAAEGAHARYTRRIGAGQVLVSVHGAPEQIEQAWRVLGMRGETEHSDHERSTTR